MNTYLEHIRLIVVTLFSTILGYITPTSNFILALIIAFGFNIWAGMRADGVSIVNCRRFKFSKFSTALFELLIYLVILELVFIVMGLCGDKEAGLIGVKTLTYIFVYVYAQNALKNLVLTYPKNMGLRIIYHVIRLEFKRAMPEHVQKIIDRIEKHDSESEDKEKEEE